MEKKIFPPSSTKGYKLKRKNELRAQESFDSTFQSSLDWVIWVINQTNKKKENKKLNSSFFLSDIPATFMFESHFETDLCSERSNDIKLSDLMQLLYQMISNYQI